VPRRTLCDCMGQTTLFNTLGEPAGRQPLIAAPSPVQASQTAGLAVSLPAPVFHPPNPAKPRAQRLSPAVAPHSAHFHGLPLESAQPGPLPGGASHAVNGDRRTNRACLSNPRHLNGRQVQRQLPLAEILSRPPPHAIPSPEGFTPQVRGDNIALQRAALPSGGSLFYACESSELLDGPSLCRLQLDATLRLKTE